MLPLHPFLRVDIIAPFFLFGHSMHSSKASSRFAHEVEMISRWLSSALPPEFNDEKLFMMAHGRDSRRLPIVQEITKSVELLKVKVEKWKAKSQAARIASAKASEDFARMIFEDIQRNVMALVNIEARLQAAISLSYLTLPSRRLCTSQTNGEVFTPRQRVFGSSLRPPGR